MVLKIIQLRISRLFILFNNRRFIPGLIPVYTRFVKRTILRGVCSPFPYLLVKPTQEKGKMTNIHKPGLNDPRRTDPGNLKDANVATNQQPILISQ